MADINLEHRALVEAAKTEYRDVLREISEQMSSLPNDIGSQLRNTLGKLETVAERSFQRSIDTAASLSEVHAAVMEAIDILRQVSLASLAAERYRLEQLFEGERRANDQWRKDTLELLQKMGGDIRSIRS